MRRSILLVIFVLIVIAAIAGGFVVYRNMQSENGQTTNQPVVVGNSNDTAVSTPPVVKGDITINQSVSYRGLTMAIDTALKTTAYRRTKAPADTTFVVLFLKPFDATPPDDLLQSAARDIRLTTAAGTSIAPYEVSLPPAAETAGGYLWFTVPTDATKLSLVFGTGAGAQTLALNL